MIKGEFLGKHLHVIYAKNPSLTGLQGTVVRETKHTIVLSTSNGLKTLLKNQVTFEIEGTQIKGDLVTVRPQQRTKLKLSKWQRKKPNQSLLRQQQ